MSSVLQTIVDSASLGGLYALLALGVAVVFGVMRLINFAQGELLMIAGYSAFLMSSLPTVWIVIFAVAITVVVSVLIERVAFRPVRGSDASTLLITSFAVSYLVQNAAMLIFGSRAKSLTLSAKAIEPVEIANDTSVPLISLIIIGVTIVVLAGLLLFLKRTQLGVQMRAAADDFPMARLLGVPANAVIATAFAISGLLAGIAGILLLTQTGTLTPTLGFTPILLAFIATIVGGMTRLEGAVLGGFLLGTVTVLLQQLLPLSLRPSRDAFVFAVVIAVLVLRPQGLLGARGPEVRL